MDWLNIHVRTLDSAEMVGAEPVDRGTWLMLSRYCIGQENGGVIRGCGQWGDRKWLAIARVMLREVRRECELWAWHGDDLHVKFYPIDKEREVQSKRQWGKIGSNRRWHGDAAPNSSPIAQLCEEPDGERNGRVREGEGGMPPPHPPKSRETEAEWLQRLRAKHPGIDVDAELVNARAFKRKQRGQKLDRHYFEFVWMKNAGEIVSEGKPAATSAPDGWQQWLVATYPQCSFVVDGKCIAGSFGLLPASVQAEAIAALKKAS